MTPVKTRLMVALIGAVALIIAALITVYGQGRPPGTPEPRQTIIETSAEELLNYLGSLRPAHKNTLVDASLKGRWVNWEGLVIDIQVNQNSFVIFTGENTGVPWQTAISFSDKWTEKIEGVNIGDTIRYLAKIEQISSNSVALIDGEFR